MLNDTDPLAFEDRPGRYTDWPLPPYRYLTGSARPHPTRGGYMAADHHRYAVTLPEPARWRQCPVYLYGVDLFNLAYWWEAHEVWEDLWKTAEDDQQRDYLQSLILTAAGLLKWHLQQARGATRLLARAVRRVEPLTDVIRAHGARTYMGLDLADWFERLTTAQLAVQSNQPFPSLVVRLDSA